LLVSLFLLIQIQQAIAETIRPQDLHAMPE
jgi:hypothetical protein